MLNLVSKICNGQGTIYDMETIRDLAGTIRIAALCGLGHSSIVPVISAMDNFKEVFDAHLDGDYCEKCRELRSVN